MPQEKKRSIVVVGSLNADLVQRVERFPRPGETVTGSDLDIVPGGKGANQACAAALLGGQVEMVGRVGSDPFGPMLIESLARAGAGTSKIQVSATSTGTAAILVLPSGENLIVISPGANGKLTPQDVAQSLGTLEPGAILLSQLEVRLETTRSALEIARQHGATTILDPAPAQTLSSEILGLVDFLTPNQTEAALLLDRSREIESYEDAENAACKLLVRGPSTVIVKLGALGVVIANEEGCQRVPGFPVQAVDSTAAGDTWNGAFAVALAEGKGIAVAARFANAAGAISVTRCGAQSSIPARGEVDGLLSG
jgi:ribokinase